MSGDTILKLGVEMSVFELCRMQLMSVAICQVPTCQFSAFGKKAIGYLYSFVEK